MQKPRPDLHGSLQRKAPGENKEWYRALFEDNPHPMWVYDPETLAFLAVNDAAVDDPAARAVNGL